MVKIGLPDERFQFPKVGAFFFLAKILGNCTAGVKWILLFFLIILALPLSNQRMECVSPICVQYIHYSQKKRDNRVCVCLFRFTMRDTIHKRGNLQAQNEEERKLCNAVAFLKVILFKRKTKTWECRASFIHQSDGWWNSSLLSQDVDPLSNYSFLLASIGICYRFFTLFCFISGCFRLTGWGQTCQSGTMFFFFFFYFQVRTLRDRKRSTRGWWLYWSSFRLEYINIPPPLTGFVPAYSSKSLFFYATDGGSYAM